MKTTYPMGFAVPKMDFWNQHNLTIEEASAYFRIGEHTMRRLMLTQMQIICSTWGPASWSRRPCSASTSIPYTHFKEEA